MLQLLYPDNTAFLVITARRLDLVYMSNKLGTQLLNQVIQLHPVIGDVINGNARLKTDQLQA